MGGGTGATPRRDPDDRAPLREPTVHRQQDGRERQEFEIVSGNYSGLLVARRHPGTGTITLAIAGPRKP